MLVCKGPLCVVPFNSYLCVPRSLKEGVSGAFSRNKERDGSYMPDILTVIMARKHTRQREWKEI